MNRLTIPISDVLVEDRQRVDYGDIDDLADSLSRFGLIQPIVINQSNRLIAGGRRYAAASKLGWKTIDVVYRETLTPDELYELELEENVRRKDLSWQERCLNIVTIHRYKVRRNILDGNTWGQKETGELLGMSVGHINNTIALAADLADKSSVLWKIDNISDAIRLLIERRENRALAALAEKEKLNPTTTQNATPIETSEATKAVEAVRADPTLLESERARYYDNPHNPSGSFDLYWSERVRLADEQNRTVYLSTRVYQGDCIEVLRDLTGAFHHVITDPPYAIDMDMLAQENQGMVDIHTVEEEHTVEENMTLLQRFIPAVFSAMEESGFLVMFCDVTQWQLIYDTAIAAGFKVQRWPITWVKSHTCMNNASAYNFTKTTELAIVCRKGNAILAKHAPTSHVVCGHDEFKEQLGHPFVKPFALWNFLIEHISQPGQVILDPFAGRGSGLLSFIKSNRHFYGCEINVEHYNALIENIKQHYLSINPRFLFK